MFFSIRIISWPIKCSWLPVHPIATAYAFFPALQCAAVFYWTLTAANQPVRSQEEISFTLRKALTAVLGSSIDKKKNLVLLKLLLQLFFFLLLWFWRAEGSSHFLPLTQPTRRYTFFWSKLSKMDVWLWIWNLSCFARFFLFSQRLKKINKSL